MSTRYFNTIIVKGDTLYKSSETNTQKLEDEYYWMNEMSKIDSLKKYVPENVDFSDGVLSMKYYEQKDLGSYFLKKSYTKEVISEVSNLLEVFEDFKSVKTDINIDFNSMYAKKTINRFRDNPFFGKYRYYLINGKVIDDLNMSLLLEKCKELDASYDIGIIHGDFFFSNIIKENNDYKLIDPRGNFGGHQTIYGDRRYDLAKLRHSISGGYDFIINNKYEIKCNNNIIDYKIKFTYDSDKVTEYFDKQVRHMGYSVENIKFLEGLMYLTMIPLHKEDLEHQTLFYAIALEKLNGFNLYR